MITPATHYRYCESSPSEVISGNMRDFRRIANVVTSTLRNFDVRYGWTVDIEDIDSRLSPFPIFRELLLYVSDTNWLPHDFEAINEFFRDIWGTFGYLECIVIPEGDSVNGTATEQTFSLSPRVSPLHNSNSSGSGFSSCSSPLIPNRRRRTSSTSSMYNGSPTRRLQRPRVDSSSSSISMDSSASFSIPSFPRNLRPQGGLLNLIDSDGIERICDKLDGTAQKSVDSLSHLIEKLCSSAPNAIERGAILEAVSSVTKLFPNQGTTTGSSPGGFRPILDSAISSTCDAVNVGMTSVVLDVIRVSVFLGSSLDYLYNRRSTSLALAVVSGSTMLLGSSYEFTEVIHSNVRTIVGQLSGLPQSSSDTILPEAGFVEDIDGFSVAISSILMGYTAIATGKTIKDIPSKLFDGLVKVDRARSSLSSMMSLAVSTIESAINWVRKDFLSKPSLNLLTSKDSRVNQFIEKYNALCIERKKGDISLSDQKFTEICALHKEATDLQLQLKEPCFAGARSLLHKYINDLGNIRLEFNKNSSCGFRMEPVCVMLRGSAGVGKSILMNHIAHAYCAATLDDESYGVFQKKPSDYVYNRTFEQTYWDQYRTTCVVTMFDDFMQARDVAGVPDNEIMNIIRAVNSFRYDLHMAKLDDKGNTCFNSSLVLCTTNAENFNLQQTVNHVKALERRIGIDVKVVPGRSWCEPSSLLSGNPDDRRFRSNLFLEEASGQGPYQSSLQGKRNIITPEMQGFIVLGRGANHGQEVNFEELMDMIIGTAKNKVDWFGSQLKTVSATEDKFRMKYACTVDGIPVLEPQSGPSLFPHQAEYHPFSSKMLDSFDPHIKSMVTRCTMTLGGFQAIERICSEVYDDFDKFRGLAPDVKLALLFKSLFELHPSVGNSEPLLLDISDELLSAVSADPFDFGDGYQDMLDRVCHEFSSMLLPQSVRLPWYEVSRRGLPTNVLFAYEKVKSSCIAIWESIRDPLSRWGSILLEFIGPWKSLLFLVIGASAIALAVFVCKKLWTFFQSFFPGLSEEPPEFESRDHMGSNRFKQKTTFRATRAQPIANPKMEIAKRDLTGYDLCESIYRSNCYSILVDKTGDGSQWATLGSILFLRGTVAIMPRHFIEYVTEHIATLSDGRSRAVKLLRKSQKTLEYMTDLGTISDNFLEYPMEGCDAGFLDLPRSVVQNMRDITGNFVRRSDVEAQSMQAPRGNIFTSRQASEDKDGNFTITAHTPVIHRVATEITVGPEPGTSDGYKLVRSYKYTAYTKRGDCGTPVFALDSRFPKRKIVGMHSAGNPSSGFCSILFQEEILEGLSVIDDFRAKRCLPPSIADDVELDMQIGDAHCLVDTHFSILGTLNPSPARSMVHGWTRSGITIPGFISDFAPSRLASKDGIDPLVVAVSGYGKNTPSVCPQLLAFARDDVLSMLKTTETEFIERRILTTHEAVFGIAGTPFRGIPTGTSPGYPMNCGSTRNLKKDMQPPPESKEIHPDHPFWELERQVDDAVSMLRQGKRILFAFTDFPKDELLKKAKVVAGKTRMISGSPFLLSVLTVKYFGSFNVWTMQNRISNGISIGIQSNVGEWHMLAQHLGRFEDDITDGLLVGAGDYSGFDKCHFPALLWEIYELYCAWYVAHNGLKGQEAIEYRLISSTLWLELVNSRHICNGVLYEWFGGLPSGHPCTAVVNSLANHILFRMCWKELRVPGRFDDRVRQVVYGDDVIYSVHPGSRKHFCDTTIGQAMAKFGYTYTNEAKDIDIQDFRKIKDVEFLKRSFRWEPLLSRYVGPLRLESVLKTPLWIKKGLGTDGVFTNCIVSIEELSLHGREVFNKWQPKIAQAFLLAFPDPTEHSIDRGLDETFLQVFGRVMDMPLHLEDMPIPMYSTNSVLTVAYSGDCLDRPTTATRECALIHLSTKMDSSIEVPSHSILTDLHPPNKVRCSALRKETRVVFLHNVIMDPGAALLKRKHIVTSLLREMNVSPLVKLLGVPNQILPQSGAGGASALATNAFSEVNTGGNDSQSAVATTTFVNDANVASSDPIAPITIPRSLYDSSTTGFLQNSLSDFLAKPYLVSAGNLSTSDVPANPLLTVYSPHDIVNSVPMYSDKLRGFVGFRGTVHFRLQVNATRFQQGRYILAFVHTGGADQSNKNAVFLNNMHTLTLCQRTQLPHVEIDITCDTEATLTIPFVNAFNYSIINAATTSNYWGAVGFVRLYAYSPLACVSGDLNAGYTLWAHFTDCEFIGPTLPQAGGGVLTSRKKKGSYSDSERESAGVGPISSLLVKVRDSANILSSVPFLTAYAAPASWVADKLAGVASVFGWSKPIDLSASMRIVRDLFPYYSNVDAVSAAAPLSLLGKNSVGVLPGFSGTNIDEMDFDFIKTIPAWHATYTIANTSGNGTQVFSLYNGVGFNVNTVPVFGGGTTAINYKPYQFIGSHFSFWRGSLVYTIKFVKTEFHSGRLVFAYFPFELDAINPTTTLALSEYVHREIIDLRMCNEVTLTIPYLSNSPWKNLGDVFAATGSFVCFVLDPIRAPATVTQSISLLLEISGGPDLEFAVPTNNFASPVAGLAPQSGATALSNPAPKGSDECAIQNSVLGNGRILSSSHLNEEACIGESITSFRTLLKQTNAIPATSSFGAVANTLNSTVYAIVWLPYSWGMSYSDSTPIFGISPNSPDLYARLSSIFALTRGGVRLGTTLSDTLTSAITNTPFTHLYVEAPNSATQAITAATSAFGVDDWTTSTTLLKSFENVQTNHYLEVQVPQYNKLHSRCTADTAICYNALAGGFYGVNTDYISSSSNVVVETFVPNSLSTAGYPSTSTTGNSNVIFHRSGSDDANFGCFISIPVMSSSTPAYVANIGGPVVA